MDVVSSIQKIQSSSAMNWPRRVSFSYRSWVAREPGLWWLYQPYIKWGQIKLKAKGGDPQERIITADTDFIIDGFQGSANSFATAVFKASQDPTIRIAHHLHSPTQIRQGAHQNVPILLTVREPDLTVLSLTKRWPHLRISQGLKAYILFYQSLMSYESHYFVSTFDLTINHLDDVFMSLNQKFNTSLKKFDLDHIKEPLKEKYKNQEREKQTERHKAIKQQELLLPTNQKLLSEAFLIYQRFADMSQKDMAAK